MWSLLDGHHSRLLLDSNSVSLYDGRLVMANTRLLQYSVFVWHTVFSKTLSCHYMCSLILAVHPRRCSMALWRVQGEASSVWQASSHRLFMLLCPPHSAWLTRLYRAKHEAGVVSFIHHFGNDSILGFVTIFNLKQSLYRCNHLCVDISSDTSVSQLVCVC